MNKKMEENLSLGFERGNSNKIFVKSEEYDRVKMENNEMKKRKSIGSNQLEGVLDDTNFGGATSSLEPVKKIVKTENMSQRETKRDRALKFVEEFKKLKPIPIPENSKLHLLRRGVKKEQNNDFVVKKEIKKEVKNLPRKMSWQ